MNIKQAGFTLIELVMVIVILGILAAVAIPKFVDLSAEAKNAATNGVAAGITSAFAINYAGKVAGGAGTAQIAGTSAISAYVPLVMQGFTLGQGQTLSGAADVSAACGTNVGSTIPISVKDGTSSVAATLICTG